MNTIINHVRAYCILIVANGLFCSTVLSHEPAVAAPISDLYAAHGAGVILRVKYDPLRPEYGRVLIQMKENIGLEQNTNLFTAAISPITSVGGFLEYPPGDSKTRPAKLLFAKWHNDPQARYFVSISRREEGYFLSRIAMIEQWEMNKDMREYAESGRLPLDIAEGNMLLHELEYHRQEMTRVQTELDPDISDQEYMGVMGPLLEHEKILQDKYFDVWSRIKVPLHYPLPRIGMDD
jgi:hypothetical protein